MNDFEIKTLVVGQLQTNCYLLIDRKIKQALIIDPGDDAQYIIEKLSGEKVTPVTIIATHGHYDHILAIFELKLIYKIPFLANRKDEFLLKNIKRSSWYYSKIKADPIPEINQYLKDKDKIQIGNINLSVMETSGHTPGSICLYFAKQNILFTGDTIFAGGGVGRTDFSYCSTSDLHDSLKTIFKLPNQTIIYPGHGEISTIKREVEFFRKGLP